MKPLFLLCLSLLIFACSEDSASNYLSIDGPLKFHGTEFEFKSSSHPNEIYYIQEYLPKGESLDSFNQMVKVYLFDTEDIDTKQAIDVRIQELDERKKTDAVCNYKLTESPDGKEFNLEFFMGQGVNDEVTSVEFNLFNYRQIELDQEKKAITIFAYTKRIYGDEISDFFKTFEEERKAHFQEMNVLEKPSIKLKRK